MEKVELPNLNLIPANNVIRINSGQHLGAKQGSSLAPDSIKSRCCSSIDLVLISFKTTAWRCQNFWAPLKNSHNMALLSCPPRA